MTSLSLSQQIYLYYSYIQYLTILILLMLIFWAIATCWVFLSYFALSTNRRTFKKYQALSRQQIDPKYQAITRTDYSKWRKTRILIGSCTLFPAKFIALGNYVVGAFFFALIISVARGYFKKVAVKLMFLYFNTYGKLMNSFAVDIKDDFEDYRIDTSILISNHTCWFDTFYLTLRFSPLSFVAKYDIKNWPVIGPIAQAMDCIFVKRQTQEGRQSTTSQIQQRVRNMKDKAKSSFPLVIYAEGTTSSDRYITKFKNGAFENLADITALCLRYECKNFDMGQDQIQQIEHIALMLSQRPKLFVKKLRFTAREGETVDEYRDRCQHEMAQAADLKVSQLGYRARKQLQAIRKQLKLKQT